VYNLIKEKRLEKMVKYIVEGWVQASVCVIVDARNPKQAIKKVEDGSDLVDFRVIADGTWESGITVDKKPEKATKEEIEQYALKS